ncbi:hypothetical protein JHK84_049816 [Glycine max]|nr:hypothetical protein JHK85_050526 [Glycine max]KAG5094228.1 hypothetical protein JHK84_049816 [Glycine max]
MARSFHHRYLFEPFSLEVLSLKSQDEPQATTHEPLLLGMSPCSDPYLHKARSRFSTITQLRCLVSINPALYGSSSGWDNTGIKEWRRRGFSSKKLLIGLPYHGYAWTLVNPRENSGVGVPTSGPAITMDGSMAYKFIKSYIRSFGNVVSHYNATFVVNQFTVASTIGLILMVRLSLGPKFLMQGKMGYLVTTCSK